MNPLEDQLRNALARREPPPGFANRVMYRIDQKQASGARWWHFGWVRVCAAAMALLLVTFGALWWQERQDRQRERARADLILALEITSSTLQHTKAKLLKTTAGGGTI